MMKKNLLYHWGSFIAALLIFSSCYDDKGNYDYRHVNEVVVESIEITPSTNISVGTGFSAIPTISDDGGNHDYTYEWIRIGGGDAGNLEVIATTKELNNLLLNYISGTYQFYLAVTDTKTGIKFQSDVFEIKYNNDINTGPLLLVEEYGKKQIYLLNFKNPEITLRKIDPENFPSIDDAFGISCSYDYMAPALGAGFDGYSVAIATPDEVYRLKHSDLTYNDTYAFTRLFLGNRNNASDDLRFTNFIAPQTQTVQGGGWLFTSEGVMYYLYSAMSIVLPVWGTYINVYNGGKFKMSEHICNFESMIYRDVVFNEDTKSFLLHSSGNLYCHDFPENTTLFPFQNTGWELLGMSGSPLIGTVSGYIRAVVKDASQNYFLISFDSNGGQHSMQNITHLTEIDKAMAFLPINRRNNLETNGFMYYYTEDKIYLFDSSTSNHKLVYTASDGRKISLVQEVLGGSVGTDMWNDEIILSSTPLENNYMICTYDPSNPDTSGSLEMKRMRGLSGELDDSFFVTYTTTDRTTIKGNMPLPATKWENQFGKVISAAWKNK